MNIFGLHDTPCKLSHEDLLISVEIEGDNLIYSRTHADLNVRKILMGKRRRIQVDPIAPITRPKHVTPYLFIEFNHPLVVHTQDTLAVLLKFPVEIGVFLLGKKERTLLDTLSWLNPEYALYGDPRSGVICRYSKSEIYTTVPEIEPLREGLLKLEIVNKSPEWTELNQVVFNTLGMRIYYDNNLVAAKAQIEIQNAISADTEFVDSPFLPKMSKALEPFPDKRLLSPTQKYFMSEGL